VWFNGPLPMAMSVCLHARTAVRVLLRLAELDVPDARALYEGARGVAWRDWLTAKSTLAVDANVRDNPALTHSGFAALKVKDAVVDSLRDALGARPDVDTDRPDVSIVLHIAGRQGALFLDLAGDPLHRCGYRVAMTDAPLKETLAAAVLADVVAAAGLGSAWAFAVRPAGGEVATESEIVPLNPCRLVMVIVELPVALARIVTLAGLAATAKSWTVYETEAE